MNCPVCKVPLIAVEREQIEVDYCISCRGLWFDTGELELLGERLGVSVASIVQPVRPASSSEKPRPCPRCGKKMTKEELHARIVVDHCPAGEGIWFDARELGALLDHATAGRDALPMFQFLGEMFGTRAGRQEKNP
jgi:Zn-finger nucleic acid-binding protein